MKGFSLGMILISLSVLIATPAYPYSAANNTVTTPENSSLLYQSNEKDYEIYNQFKGMESPYEGPLPWEGDQKFIEAVKKNNTPVLMASYRAILHDPILAEGYNIALAAKQLAGTVVQPGEIFSQNNTIGPYTESRGYRAGPTYSGNQLVTTVGGGVCKIATMLYNVTTFSDLKIIMRNSHSMIVPYVPPGQDATVCYGVRDFRFLNDSGGPIMIWSQKEGNTLYMAVYGSKKPPRVTWHHRVIKKHPYWTIYRDNPSLPSGTEKIVSEGMDGYIVNSWVTVEMPDGTVINKKKGMSFYSACPQVVEQGTMKK
ncbi:MAG: VanW family protein [Bacillota bacterium]